MSKAKVLKWLGFAAIYVTLLIVLTLSLHRISAAFIGSGWDKIGTSLLALYLSFLVSLIIAIPLTPVTHKFLNKIRRRV